MSSPAHDPLPQDREGLIGEARTAIYRGDYAFADTMVRPEHRPSVARAHYARASVLIQLAGYLGMTEEHNAQDERWRLLSTPPKFVEFKQPITSAPTPIVSDEPIEEVALQGAYLAGREHEAELARDTGGTSQRRGAQGDPWRNR